LGSFEPVLREETGASKQMEQFVVYQNFPAEVLSKTKAEYWLAQLLMYMGIPNECFTENPLPRAKMLEAPSLKVLHLATPETIDQIYSELINVPSRWTKEQTSMAYALYPQMNDKQVDVVSAKFKENMIRLAGQAFSLFPKEDFSHLVKINNATDILRFAALLSDGDVSLKTKITFKKFTRPERKMLLSFLNEADHLLDDVFARPSVFKRFFYALKPGDYSFEKVSAVYDKLYKNEYITLNKEILNGFMQKDLNALLLLRSRPGEFFRKLHHAYSVYGQAAITAFSHVVPSLKNIQLLKLLKYIETINERKKLIFAPKGNWSNAKVFDNEKIKFDEEALSGLKKIISLELSNRLSELVPEGIALDDKTKEIKLQTNDQELAPYGRGTSFDIPENMTFIRTASYWSIASERNVWFDNGWNFFGEDWQPIGTCCWDQPNELNDSAVFSGDPTNVKDLNGRACQMIDLYLDKLTAQGVRFAVWNILCYSGISFKDADVLATLQYGEKAESGSLYEPSRAQMVFPLKGDNQTKYIAYIDLKTKKLIYMDANLYGNVLSAQRNETVLQEKMPAFIEYIDSLPSVYDLFKHAQKGTIPVLYSDKEQEVKEGRAYVFKKENTENSFDDFVFNELLSEK